LPIHADIKTIRKEISRLRAELFGKYSTPEAYYARAKRKKDALVFSEIIGVLQVALFICELYDTFFLIFASPRFKEQGLENVMKMVLNHYSYLGHVVTFWESIDTIHDPDLREYGDQMIKVLIKLLHTIDAVEEELQL